MKLYTYSRIRSIKNEAFERGEKHGIKIAIDNLRDAQKHDCINLSEKEKEKVMLFLIENSLEFGYSVENGGFYVFKKTFKSE